jgi:hypothetical protein
MVKYLDWVRQLQSCLYRVALTKKQREDNVRANALSRLGSGTEQDIEASAQEVIILAKPLIALQNMMQVDDAPTDPDGP